MLISAKRDFEGRTALVVGGSSGIGLATARALARAGADLVLMARDEGRLDDAVAELEAERALPEQRFARESVDITDHVAVAAAVDRAVARHRAPDVVINCAGIARAEALELSDYAAFDEIVKVNLYGVYNVIKAALPHLAPGAVIVNVASVAGFLGLYGYTAYSASKFAVMGLSEALRNELQARGIHVVVACPPDTRTPGLSAERETRPRETEEIAGKASLLEPEAVARAIVKGIRKRRALVIPGVEAKLTHLAVRLFPRLVRGALDRTVRRVAKGRAGPNA